MAIRGIVFTHLTLNPTVDDTLCGWETTTTIVCKVFSSTPSVAIMIKSISASKAIRMPLRLSLEIIAPPMRYIAPAKMFVPMMLCRHVFFTRVCYQ